LIENFGPRFCAAQNQNIDRKIYKRIQHQNERIEQPNPPCPSHDGNNGGFNQNNSPKFMIVRALDYIKSHANTKE